MWMKFNSWRKDYPSRKDLLEFAASTITPLIELSIKTELEISELDPEDRGNVHGGNWN